MAADLRAWLAGGRVGRRISAGQIIVLASVAALLAAAIFLGAVRLASDSDAAPPGGYVLGTNAIEVLENEERRTRYPTLRSTGASRERDLAVKFDRGNAS